MITLAFLYVVVSLVAAFFIGAGIHLADARAPRPEAPELETAA